jgi:hypothetical protein
MPSHLLALWILRVPRLLGVVHGTQTLVDYGLGSL